jgi:hypothetical protein
MLLKESGFKGCENCPASIDEHLSKIEEPCLKHYSIKILRKKLEVGLSAYNGLKSILKSNVKEKRKQV